MKFVLASHNRKKLAEMQEILGELGVEVVLQSDVGLDLEPEENGTTFAENAAIKAMAVMQASGLPAIADDSGLCVDALNGAPGIYSARYGGVDSDAGPVSPAAGESPGCRGPHRPFPHGHRLLLPQWGPAGRRRGLLRHHCLRPPGGQRLRL